MEPDNPPSLPATPSVNPSLAPPATPQFAGLPEKPDTAIQHIFLGPHGIRAGWRAGAFLLLFLIFSMVFAIPIVAIFGEFNAKNFTPMAGIADKLLQLLPMLAAWAVMALIEQRKPGMYFLADRRPISHSATGAVCGFAMLSLLVGGLFAGHWATLGPPEMAGRSVAVTAATWAIVFLMTALFEEGAFRCYLLFTLTQGFGGGKRGFWTAAALLSVIFGGIHLFNSDESAVGILCAMLMGFVFCVSVRLTGSAWWAIGFHAAWDWAETFFYGTADSGIVSRGHWLTTIPMGNRLWSGGSTGPEGSLLFLPTVMLILALLFLLYRRGRTAIPVGGKNSLENGPVAG